MSVFLKWKGESVILLCPVCHGLFERTWAALLDGCTDTGSSDIYPSPGPSLLSSDSDCMKIVLVMSHVLGPTRCGSAAGGGGGLGGRWVAAGGIQSQHTQGIMPLWGSKGGG